ncbi:serine protease [Streptomyces sp. NPDC006551]|uniref:serine protease n=1 Tax=Streptomyces sp. NPDC006551 TaxID=3157178 RepID=UPI0033A750F1
MTGVRGRDAEEAESALVSAVVRVKGPDGAIGGAGFLIAPDLVLTCAHVVSDALDRPREHPVEAGTEVTVDLPLAGNADGVDGGDRSATVQRWIPIRPDQTGDIAVLRLRDRIPGARPLPMTDPPHGVWDHDARSVGFTDDHPDGIWQSGRFRGPTRQGWIQLARSDGEAVYVKGGFSGSPVWDDESGAAVGMMVAAQPVREAQQAFVLRMRTLLREVPELAPAVSPATPFRGLSTFQEDDADVFFGRDDDIDRVVTALRGDHPTVTVYGPSGCGKSSLALAGVAPRMRESGYRILRIDAVRFTSVRAALAAELFEAVRSGQCGPPRAESADQVEEWLARLGLADTVHRALGASAGRVLVVLDQAEALLDSSEAVTEEVAGLLFPERRQDGVRVLVTLRADFMDAALNHAHLGSALKRGVTVPLTPMSRDQLAEVIREPVARVPAVEYDPGLERRILDDAGGEPGILPLLGFVLAQLWEHRTAGRLRTATYEENEGVSGALRLHAEQAWRECVEKQHTGQDGAGDKTDQEALRLLTGLVRVLPGSEAPLRRMLTREEAGETRWRIATSLAERRLLVLHGAEGESQSVELAHEALISAWPTLARQVRADGEFLAGRAELAHDLDRWQKADRPPELLPGSLQLLSLRSRLRGREAELTPAERDFLERARRRHRTRRNRVRAAWIASALVLALIAGLATFLVHQSQVNARQEAEGRSRSLASLSDELTKRDPGLAALVAIGAHDIAPTQEARNALLRGYDRFREDSWALTGTESPVRDVATSTDGAVTLVTTEIGRSVSGRSGAVLFVRKPGGKVHREYLRLDGQVRYPLVSRDGRRIAYLSARRGGTLVWYDVRRDAEDVLGPPRTVHHSDFGDIPVASFGQSLGLADFSPDAGEVVMVVGGRARLWELATRKGRGLPSGVPALEKVWFGPDENTLVAQPRYGPGTNADSSVMAVDITTGGTRELANGVSTSARPRLALSGDGGVLAFCRKGRGGQGAVYRAVRVTDGRSLATHTPDSTVRPCDHAIAIDGTGEHFAVRGLLNEWTIVDTRPGGPVREATGPRELPDADDLTLVGAPGEPVLVTWDETAVTGRPLSTGTVVADSPPVLLGEGEGKGKGEGEGNEMLVRMSEGGNALGLTRMDVRGRTTVLKKVPRPSRTTWMAPQETGPSIGVNRAQTLAADLVGRNRIRVWAVPSLRQVTDVTTAAPPVDRAGKARDDVEFYFVEDDELLTVSGGLIEHWNARTGRRLSKTIDVRDLGLTEQDPPRFTVSRHPEPGHTQLMVEGSPVIHAIDLRTGKENKALLLRFGPEVDRAILDDSGRYAAVELMGGMAEVWSVRPGRPVERVLGPLGPLHPYDMYQAGFLRDRAEFFLANGSSIRFQNLTDSSGGDFYSFTEEQEFLAASKDGKALLRLADDNGMNLLRLDAELWKNQLCETLGRGPTEDERRGLPTWLPHGICPG